MAKTRLKEDENAVVSPFSMAAVLSMLHAGSRGETARQIKDGLQLTDWMKDDNIYTEIGNTLREVKVCDFLLQENRLLLPALSKINLMYPIFRVKTIPTIWRLSISCTWKRNSS